MLKPLTKEAIADQEIEAKFAGKMWAYTAVVGDYGYQLGIAVENEPGYTPVPGFFCHGDDYMEMCDHADALNTERSIDPREGGRIVASSMRAGKIAKAA